MTLDYTSKGKVKISMYEYIEKKLAELPSDMDGVSKTPAALHLFNADEGAEKLLEEKGQLFHHQVAKLIFMSKNSTRHPNCCGISMYQSTGIRHR